MKGVELGRRAMGCSEMATYLLTWNPNKWDWKAQDDFQDCLVELEEQGRCADRWSCGNNLSISPGDRLFLMRLGKEPKGIVASGYATSGVYEDEHWEAGHGGKAFYVCLRFDVLDPDLEPILPLSELKSVSNSMNWTPQMSGIRIKDEVASNLEASWSRFLGYKASTRPPQEVPYSAAVYEGAVRQIKVNAYERSAEARRRCIARYGHSCSACEFNFESTYGDAGKDFIHVHHLVPLSEVGDEYEVDPEKDLRPVCPNCHAIIHRKKPPYTIDEIKKLLAVQKDTDVETSDYNH